MPKLKRSRVAAEGAKDEGGASGRGKRSGTKRRRTEEGGGVERTDVDSAIRDSLGEKHSRGVPECAAV